MIDIGVGTVLFFLVMLVLVIFMIKELLKDDRDYMKFYNRIMIFLIILIYAWSFYIFIFKAAFTDIKIMIRDDKPSYSEEVYIEDKER